MSDRKLVFFLWCKGRQQLPLEGIDRQRLWFPPPAAFGQLKQQARKDIVEGSLSASRLKGSTRLTPRELAFRFASDLAFIPPPLPGFHVIVCYASL